MSVHLTVAAALGFAIALLGALAYLLLRPRRTFGFAAVVFVREPVTGQDRTYTTPFVRVRPGQSWRGSVTFNHLCRPTLLRVNQKAAHAFVLDHIRIANDDVLVMPVPGFAIPDGLPLHGSPIALPSHTLTVHATCVGESLRARLARRIRDPRLAWREWREEA